MTHENHLQFFTLSLNTGADYSLFIPTDPFSTLVFPAMCARKLTIRLHHWASVHSGCRLGSANWDTSRKLRIGGEKCQGVRLTWFAPAWCGSGNGCIPPWPMLLSDSPSSWVQLQTASGNSLVSSCLYQHGYYFWLFLSLISLPTLSSLIGSSPCLYLCELLPHTTICIWPLWECHLFLVRIWFILWLKPQVALKADPEKRIIELFIYLLSDYRTSPVGERQCWWLMCMIRCWSRARLGKVKYLRHTVAQWRRVYSHGKLASYSSREPI